MDGTEAPWKAPSASYIAARGFLLGVAGGCVLGAVFGAGVLVIDALINEPLQLGTVVGRTIGGGIYGAIFGTGVGTIASLVVVPVVTMWLRTAGVQGQSASWVRRRAQLLAIVVTALVVYCTMAAFADWSEPFGSFVLFAVPGVLAIGYSAWVARSLVTNNPRGLSARAIDSLYD